MGNELKHNNEFRDERIFHLGMSTVGIAHDLNNFLCAIIAYADMALEDSVGDSRITGNLNCLLSVSEQAKSTVEELLSYARTHEISRGEVDLASIVRKVMTLVMSSAPDSLLLNFENTCDSYTVRGNGNQLYQCVMNLAMNAAQAMNNKGELRFILRRMKVAAQSEGVVGPISAGEYLVLDVVDTGPGIAPALMDRIFQPFFSTKISSKGCGLGLAIIANIMSSHQGNILVHSIPGSGTTFSLFFFQPQR